MDTKPRKRGLRVSNGGRAGFFFLLASLCLGADAATIEKPIYAKFKDVPIKENPVMGYVQFGQLGDGTPALQKINSSTVRLYTRNTLFRLGSGDYTYSAEELNCRTGMMEFIGMSVGTPYHVTAQQDPPPPLSMKEVNPKNLPVYREVCTTTGIQPAW